ncbi:hypothetical protein OG21DRAFT_1508699 [Imleria badia]|nr:hypothetical protein OG21DRAFT_1508699 [Imleria badia]
MNQRLSIDRRRAKLPNRPSIPKQIRLTWQPILPDTPRLPQNWVTNLEVLVGIRLPRPSDQTEDTRQSTSPTPPTHP